MKNIISILTMCCILATTFTDAQAFSTTSIKDTATRFSDVGSKAFDGYGGYKDAKENKDEGTNKAINQGVYTATTVTAGVSAAAINGAGSLAGYAGVSSAVSSLGLGGVTTSIAGAMGSSASGAAATAVVTSVVGGPLVMGAILVAGTAGATYGLYKCGQALGKWLSD
jgi:hypothetical protein